MKNQFLALAFYGAFLGAFLSLASPSRAQMPKSFKLDKKITTQQSPDQTTARAIFFQESDKKTFATKIQPPLKIQSSLSAFPHVDTQDRNNFGKIYQDTAFQRQVIPPADPFSGKPKYSFIKGADNILETSPNEGSVDSGIFYAPAETATPAAKILKPLADVDPQMVIDPDKQ